jgi:hypothetical protein
VAVTGVTEESGIRGSIAVYLKGAEAEINSLPASAGLLLGLLFDLIMEAKFSSETSGFLRTTRHYCSEDCFLQDLQKYSFLFILYSCGT